MKLIGEMAGSDFSTLAEPEGLGLFQAPIDAGITVLQPDGENPERLHLTGIAADASPGGQPGISLRIPEDLERAVSGKAIEISVLARQPPDAGSALFAASYSTNDAGNSGWRQFALTEQWTAFSFRYDVPEMRNGRGDFVGLLPDANGEGGAIEVAAVSLSLVVSDDQPMFGIVDLPTRATATATSTFYDLHLDKLDLPSTDGSRGALTLLRESVVYAAPTGRVFLISDAGSGVFTSIVELDPPIPLDVDSPALGHFHPRTLSIFDIAASDESDHRSAELYASYLGFDHDKQCLYLALAVAPLSITDDSPSIGAPWRDVFRTEPCISAATTEDWKNIYATGGRIDFDPDGDIILTVGEFLGPDVQDDAVDYGKTIKIDRQTLRARPISKGHRNAQGLYVDATGTIYQTEHGPMGGDEVNIVVEGGNYGWPLVTYGADYGKKVWPRSEEQGQHRDFDKPIFAFVPSIGISQIIGVTSPTQFPHWQGDLLVASLKARTIYRLHLDGTRVIVAEPIIIGERVRDLEELPDGRIVFLTDSQWLFTMSRKSVQSGEKIVRPAAGYEARTISPETGNASFATLCADCHAIDLADGNGIGPNLGCVVGRPVASLADFPYTPPLAEQSSQVWSAENLQLFLASPENFASGSAMAAVEFADPEDISAITALLIESTERQCP